MGFDDEAEDIIDFLDQRQEALGIITATERLTRFCTEFMSLIRNVLSKDELAVLFIAERAQRGEATRLDDIAALDQVTGRIRALQAGWVSGVYKPEDTSREVWINACLQKCFPSMGDRQLAWDDIADVALFFLAMANELEDHWDEVMPMLRKHFP